MQYFWIQYSGSFFFFAKVSKILRCLDSFDYYSNFLGHCYSITLDGLGPSGFDLVRAASISQIECSTDQKTNLEPGVKYQLNYPGIPDKHEKNK